MGGNPYSLETHVPKPAAIASPAAERSKGRTWRTIAVIAFFAVGLVVLVLIGTTDSELDKNRAARRGEAAAKKIADEKRAASAAAERRTWLPLELPPGTLRPKALIGKPQAQVVKALSGQAAVTAEYVSGVPYRIDVKPKNFHRERDEIAVVEFCDFIGAGDEDLKWGSRYTNISVNETGAAVIDVTVEREGRKIKVAADAVDRRRRFAGIFADMIRAKGWAVSIDATGADAKTLNIEFAGCSRPQLETLAADDFFARQRSDLGFKRVQCTDGLATWSVDY